LQSGIVKGTASTDASGSYTINGLPSGSYDIRGSAGGFTPQTQTGVVVSGGTASTVSFSLSVATAAAGIVYIYDELQRLKSVIDPVGEAATYGYDAVGNLLSITRNNSSQTSIIDFNPNAGAVGSTVTIHGTGYSATPSQNSVTFNGTAATVVSSTLTQIVTAVPAGATAGPIAVTSPAGGASSVTAFNVTGGSGAPTITNFTPNIGVVGTAITITGTNFDTTPQNNEVRFNPTLGSVTAAMSTQLSTAVPFNGRPGKISVSTPAGTAVSTTDLFLMPSGFNAADIEYTGRAVVGGDSHTVTITTPGKNGMVLFDGTMGQKVSLGVNSSTINTVNTYIYKPEGPLLASAPTGTGTNIDMTLPVSGTYTILIDPYSTYTGSVTFTLSEAINVGPIVIDGSPVTVTVPRIGQHAYLTFSGTAGQKLGLGVSANTMSGSNTNTYVNKPDGALLTWDGFTGTGMNLDMTLPVSGTYTIVLNPYSTSTGSVTYVLSEVINAGTIGINDSSVTVTVPRIGQQADLTFDGSSGQSLRLTFNSNTMTTGSTNTYVFKPDGSQLTWSGNTPTGGYLDMTLPVTGTYTIWLNPYSTGTGSVTYTLAIN